MSMHSESHYQRYLARKRQKQQDKEANQTQPGESRTGTWQMAQAANAPIHECLVPENLFEQGIGNLAFSRRLPDGSMALAMFLLDVFCLGVKNAFFTIVTRETYDQRLRGWPGPGSLQPMHPACFRKLVEGGVAYARELGFNPHVDYAEARRLFGDLETTACPTHFVYGHAGKPLYISGPDETPTQARSIVEQLEQRLGSGNFHYLVGVQ